MPTITHKYTVDDTVFILSGNEIKSGVVVKVDADVTSSGTTVTYLVRVGNTASNYTESQLYANCKAEGGYQNLVFQSNLNTATVLIPKGSLPVGSVLSATAVIDGGPTQSFSLTIAAGAGSPSVSTVVTVQDVLNNLNNTLTPVADATIVENNIRITSRSKGTTSTVVLSDGDLVGSPTGSPLQLPYFQTLSTFTGLSASVSGKGNGALEALSQQVC